MTLPTADDSSRLRFSILLIVVGCLFVALIARLYFLDVLDTSGSTVQINASIQRVILTPAPRGEILDREGQPLVDNISIPTIEVQRQDWDDTAMVTRLGALLGMPVKTLAGDINNVQYTGYDYVPVYANATAEQMLYVEEHPSDFPGVVATTLTEPHVTALGEYAANIVGYVGPISKTELKAWRGQGYAQGDIVGQAGAEYSFQNELNGTPGKTVIDVNAQGVELSQVSYTPPVPGKNIRLTINGGLQKLAVEELRTQEANSRKVRDTYNTPVINFESYSGAVVAEDPKNGQLLALATDPSYNPNLFDDDDLSDAAYNRIKNDDGLYDLAVQGQYAPGSTFKLVTATAGLKYGFVTPSTIYDDKGYIMIGNEKFSDDDGQGAGDIDLTGAITVSSDNYFNQIGVDLWDQRGRVGDDALQKIAGDYGFNQPTGIDLPGETFQQIKVNGKWVNTQIPTPAIDAALHADDPTDYPYGDWTTGVSAHMAIGQQLTVTPLQLANAYSAFANGGTLYTPRVGLDAETASGKVVKRFHANIDGHTPTLTSEQRQSMLAGFVGVVNNPQGTANIIFANTPLAGEDIAGKTGTAQVTGTHVVDGKSMPQQDSSVFTSFAPASNPQYVIDCFMPDAGYGADAAAPVVRSLWDYVFGKPIQAPTYLNPGSTSGLQN